MSSSYYTKRESFRQNQWEILNCLHAQLSVERLNTQTSFRKLNGNKMNETASMGQSRQEGVVFFGVWDKTGSTHLFWQGHGCWFRAAVWENIREQRICCWTWSPNASIAYQQYLASGCSSCRMFRIVWPLTLLVLLGLLYSPGMPFFRLLCVGERKDAHINVSSFVLDWVFIDFKVQAFQPWLGLWSSPTVTSLQKEEHQSQEWLVLLADGDLIVALLCLLGCIPGRILPNRNLPSSPYSTTPTTMDAFELAFLGLIAAISFIQAAHQHDQQWIITDTG